jgi:hypothetical protein
MRSGVSYVVKTNLPPAALTEIAVEIFVMWLDFAMGGAVLNGRRLIYPSGRYAAAIRMEQRGDNSIAIIADEDAAPEAAILETGHRSFDLKKAASQLSGRAIPMHRAHADIATQKATGLRRVGGGPASVKPSVWAEIRRSEGSGYASFGPNSDPGSWIIPAMPAYAPAFSLAMAARRLAIAAGG